MHTLEPHYNWRHLYMAEEDPRSPFFEREYSEFEFTNTIYNYYIHPQWDDIGSPTLYIKILFVNYDEGAAIIEMLGEWNDAVYNDIMTLKRDIIDELIHEGIHKFVLIGENILNFHYSDDSYYEEWFEDIEDGWIAFINFRPHVLTEMKRARIDWFVQWGGELDEMTWRTHAPIQLLRLIESIIGKRLG